MAGNHVLTQREWHRSRSVVRAIVGLACFFNQLAGAHFRADWLTLTCAVYAVYGLLTLLWVWTTINRLQTSLASLLIETVFFLVFAAYGMDRDAWLGSVFFLYLMAAAVLQHNWSDVFIVVLACLGFFAFVRVHVEGDVLSRVVLIAGVLSCVFALQKRRLEQRLTDSIRREDTLLAEAEKARDQERQRIAGDFHDGPLQTFIGLQVRLDILGTLMKRDRAAAAEDLAEIQQLAKAQVTEIRSFLRSMKPLEIDDTDLVASARRITEYFQKDTGISARFVSSEASLKLAAETTHEMLQILREALHNVQKHSKASRVVVSVEQAGKTVEVAVDDDGSGFSFAGSFSLDELDLLRLGPQSIKRRVHGLAGDLQIESRPGHGAGLKIRIPV